MTATDPVEEEAKSNGVVAKHEAATLKCQLVKEFVLRALREAEEQKVTIVIRTGSGGTVTLTESKLFCLHEDKI